MIRSLPIATLALGFLISNTTASVSLAQVVPYKAAGTGVSSPVTGDLSGPGKATHLGKLTFTGQVETFSVPENRFAFTFQSTEPIEDVAANGDTILFETHGLVTLIPRDSTFTTFTAHWTGKFVVIGGTGRFAKVGPADEPLDVVADHSPFTFLDPEWSFSWEINGQIVLH